MTSETLDAMSGRRLFLKCENLQKVGAFKYRGASNAVLSLDSESASRGVVTHSSGNHAQALALAAKRRGIPAHVVMPRNAPDVKRRAVEGYGARVVPCDPTLQSREDTAAAVIAETGAAMVPSYDDARVIAGQGTVALELLEQCDGDLDVVVAPLGGGGLLSGIALALRELRPQTLVIGGEPEGADDAARSKSAGMLLGHSPGKPSTIADGLLTTLGTLTWPVVRDVVARVIVVDDDAIRRAMRLLWERTKLVVEPSGAVPLAVVLSDAFRDVPGERVGIVLSGGNVDLDRFRW
ncbi:MAG: pyridoxal-phosphate dependent enzyme [Deltaproteobacteria bacterium]|nr:pyridoxal-phosphate dependent enzyme [Deltaproteobacteria bacterium]